MGAGDPQQTTRASLLSRLRRNPDDATAWDEFVARYGPSIRGWCAHWRLAEPDAQEGTQLVLVRLAVKMRSFTYDPSRSFRAWLKTLARHAWSDFLSDRQRGGIQLSSGDCHMLESIEARTDLEQRLSEAFDLELLEIATERVRQRVAPHTWRAFELTAMDGEKGADVAARLNTSVASVYKAKSNIQQMLREEVQSLDNEPASS